MLPYTTVEHLADYDLISLEDQALDAELLNDVATNHHPALLTQAGLPIAALIGLEDLTNLYEELRCLRMLYSIAEARLPHH